jgi:hypothetical protein
METQLEPTPTAPVPVPARDGRHAPSRRRVLATGIAVAGLTATGGLAVVLSVAATSGPGAAADASANEFRRGDPAGPPASVDPNATTPRAVPGGTTTRPSSNGAAPLGGQPPQLGQGGGPGHASTGGS